MITQPDLIIFNVVSAAFANISQNVDVLAKIFAGHTDTEITDIQAFFSTNVIRVNWGWARQPTDAGIGAVYISIDSSREVPPYQFIGQQAPIDADDFNTLGNYIECNTKLTCVATNPNKVSYISDLVKYILYLNRQNLETNYGLQEQLLSISPLVPESRLDPDIFTFRRDVTLNSKHIDTVDIIEVNPQLLKHIIIEPEASVDSSFSFTIS